MPARATPTTTVATTTVATTTTAAPARLHSVVGKVGIESGLYDHLAPGDRCDGVLNDMAEFGPGWTVVVTDTAGRRLGEGEIGLGFIDEPGLCAWPFEVLGVPEVDDGYRIGMAVFTPDKHVFVPLEEMHELGWNVGTISWPFLG